jgi:hypothetical protein
MSTFVVNDLTDPHVLQKEYPNSVHAIQDVYKPNVEVGYYVKLRRNGAYFWVKVTNVDGTTITGEIYHPLACNPRFGIGDFIVFQICYAFDIYNPYTFELIPRLDQVQSM